MLFFFFFKQKTAYEMRISDWSSDVCSSDLSTCAIWQQAADAGPACRNGASSTFFPWRTAVPRVPRKTDRAVLRCAACPSGCGAVHLLPTDAHPGRAGAARAEGQERNRNKNGSLPKTTHGVQTGHA